jgi:PAS domain S-box-containing protein
MDPILLNEIMSNVTSGVTVADATKPDMPLIFINKGFEVVTGYRREEALGKNCRFLQGDLHDQPGLTVLRKALAKKEACVVRLKNFKKNGTLFHNELHISPVHDATGAVTHFVGIQHDVSEQVRTREALEESQMLLKQSLHKEKELNEIKSAFISMISHEFRTPMTGIKTSSALLRRYGHIFEEEKLQRHYNNIETSLTRMDRLVDDVLFFSRAEAGKLKIHRKPVNLKTYFESLQERMDQEFRHRTINYHYNLLPESEATYMLDEHLLDHILQNLIGNALKYSTDTLPVDVFVDDQSTDLKFTVKDRGIGIPMDDQEQLFEPFHRARNVEARKGTGLGLNIAKRAAGLMDGGITFMSAESVGSTFVVNLPKTGTTQS